MKHNDVVNTQSTLETKLRRADEAYKREKEMFDSSSEVILFLYCEFE